MSSVITLFLLKLIFHINMQLIDFFFSSSSQDLGRIIVPPLGAQVMTATVTS